MMMRGSWGSIYTLQYYHRASKVELLNVAKSLSLSDSKMEVLEKKITPTETTLMAMTPKTGSCGTLLPMTSQSSTAVVQHQDQFMNDSQRQSLMNITSSFPQIQKYCNILLLL